MTGDALINLKGELMAIIEMEAGSSALSSKIQNFLSADLIEKCTE